MRNSPDLDAGNGAEPLDVTVVIDRSRFSSLQRWILLLCFLIMATDGFDTVAVGYVGPALVASWGVSKLSLGPLFSAALIGLAVGALAAGPMGDRFGRRNVLIGSVLAFGLFTLASTLATSMTQLTALRVLTGIGLGAAMPNAVTLLSEYSPEKHRSLLVNVMFCGFALGASAAGFTAASVIPAYGWESIFVIGGAAPIALAVALVKLPESIRFLVLRSTSTPAITQVLKRIDQAFVEPLGGYCVPLRDLAGGQAPLVVLFSRRYRIGSYLLWLTSFMGLVVYYLMTSWMPTLMRESGFSLKQAAMMTALLSLGAGVGPVICGWLMDRVNSYRVVGGSFALAAVLVLATGRSLDNIGALPYLIFLTGVFLAGALSSMPVLASSFYPTCARVSGVAWMLGIGRFGGIVGALSGGPLLDAGLSIGLILSLLAIPACVAGAALLVQSWISGPDMGGLALEAEPGSAT